MKGQALVELALCVPVILVLALGAVTAVQVLEAEGGLRAATEAAISAAARAPDVPSAIEAGRSTFASVIASYPVRAPAFKLAAGGFARGSLLSADSVGIVDSAVASIPLHAHAALLVEPWRARP